MVDFPEWRKQFPLGSIVTLKSGGPKMTVKVIVDDVYGGDMVGLETGIHCSWFAQDNLKQGCFHPTQLVKEGQ